MSPALSKPESGLLPRKLLSRYLLLLRLYPVLTKAVTSALLSAIGSLLAEIIAKSQKKKDPSWGLDLRGPLRFAVYGFLFTGPLSHYFYLYLEQLIPSDVPLAIVKRLLVDRLLVAPAFLVLFFFVMNALEGKDTSAFLKKMKSHYWTALKMNWKVWTPVQFINLTYVPVQVGTFLPMFSSSIGAYHGEAALMQWGVCWTVRKAERRTIDAFELWCWRTIPRVPWTARRSNQSMFQEIKPDCSLEGMIVKAKLKYFGHIMRRQDTLEKMLMLGKEEGERKRGRPRTRWMDDILEFQVLFGNLVALFWFAYLASVKK